MKRTTLLFLVVLLGGAGAASAWWSTRATTVPATVVHKAPLVQTLQFSARVATRSRVEIGSTLTGRVSSVSVVEGAQVRRGEVLLRLESEELNAALAQARAGERQALARLTGLRGSSRGVALAAVAQAESVLRAARADGQRTQELVAKGFLSEARLDDATRAVAVAQAQLDGAKAQSAATADRGSDIAQAESQLALARGSSAAAAARLAQAALLAPADATVLTREVEPGQIVQPGRALLSLALAGPVQLVAPVDERYLEQMRVGQTASVLADAFPQSRFPARVLSIAPMVDAQRGAIEVKFELPGQTPDFLREDMTLSVELETARREQVLVVPAGALRDVAADGRATVWVEREGRAARQPLRLGLHTLDAAEVLEGLNEGDVVLFGPGLVEGRRVRADTTAPLPAGGRRAAGEDAGSAVMNTMGR